MKTMFQVMSSVTKGYEPTPEELKSISPFIWCRYLCGSPKLISYALLFNNSDVPMDLQYRIIRNACKMMNIKYIPYPKNLKEESSKELEALSWYFKINPAKSKEYLELISKDELNNIMSLYIDMNTKR